ncbi:MAG: hypothetical protein HKP58_09375 [Desulfatitalea sp.]|nr:hypothetical protein [Desulfatitalea sp.]NNK00612.1 hypothetical protein [Desulfatitalea sp.]
MNRKPKKARLFMVVGVLFLLAPMAVPGFSWAQEVTLVVNKDVAVSAVSADEINSIFLGKKTTWDTGEKINFAIFEQADVLAVFTERYLKKSAAQFKNYWKSMVFTGKGNMPPAFKSREAVFEFVSSTKGAIAFVSGPAAASVKAVQVQ